MTRRQLRDRIKRARARKRARIARRHGYIAHAGVSSSESEAGTDDDSNVRLEKIWANCCSSTCQRPAIDTGLNQGNQHLQRQQQEVKPVRKAVPEEALTEKLQRAASAADVGFDWGEPFKVTKSF